MEEGLDHIVDVTGVDSLEKENSAAINHANLVLNMIGSDHKRLQDLSYKALTSDLADKIGTYFAVHATKYIYPEGNNLSLSSAMGYISCYKVHCINKYRWERTIFVIL